jgi:hypothetical protein
MGWMKVKELMALLEGMDPEAPVVIAAQDTGYHEIGQVKKVGLGLNAQEDDRWNGPHMDYDGYLEDYPNSSSEVRRCWGVRLLTLGHL